MKDQYLKSFFDFKFICNDCIFSLLSSFSYPWSKKYYDNDFVDLDNNNDNVKYIWTCIRTPQFNPQVEKVHTYMYM